MGDLSLRMNKIRLAGAVKRWHNGNFVPGGGEVFARPRHGEI
jgi:hypothetical protein